MIIKINGRQMEGGIQTRMNDSAWDGRESKAITVEMGYTDAVALFGNDVPWSVVQDMERDDGSAVQVENDMSEYAISGPITDNRDGTVTVRMGKYREEELMHIPLAEVPASHGDAVKLRGIIEAAVQGIADDSDALTAKALYPAWEALHGVYVDTGVRFTYEGKLYKVISAHTVAPNWIPGEGTQSLYACIDESHAGTPADPIPYDGNMALTEGLYYSQYGTVYLCTRSTGNPVYNALSSLVGLYVEAVA